MFKELKKVPAHTILFSVGGLNILFGLFSELIPSGYKTVFGISMIGSILYGLMFLLFGFFVRSKSTKILLLAIILFSIDGIGYLIAYLLFLFAGANRPITLLFFYVLAHIPLIQKMIGDLKIMRASANNT